MATRRTAERSMRWLLASLVLHVIILGPIALLWRGGTSRALRPQPRRVLVLHPSPVGSVAPSRTEAQPPATHANAQGGSSGRSPRRPMLPRFSASGSEQALQLFPEDILERAAQRPPAGLRDLKIERDLIRSLGVERMAQNLEAWFLPRPDQAPALHGIARRALPRGTNLPGVSPSTHRISHLRTVVRAHHDDKGRPKRWEVLESSGRAEFDALVLRSIREAGIPATAPTELAGKSSNWAIESSLYFWSRKERILDPLFRPFGQKVESLSSAKGDVYADRQIRYLGG